MSALEHLLVLEFASVLAGPSVGQFLAELGARVIKIEHPASGGDVTRSWRTRAEAPGQDASYFNACNFGKESVAIDLAHPSSRDIVEVLVRRADVVLSSFGPGSAARLGLDDATLRSWNPAVIHGAITGYGTHDPRPGYDAVIQAESGFMALNGVPDGPPLKMPVALMDLLAAHHLKEAILLALLERERSGQGAFLEVSLLDAALVSLANQATAWMQTGVVPSRQGSRHPNISPYGTLLRCRDHRDILLAVGTDPQFRRLCETLEVSSLADDPRFASNTHRVEHRDLLEQALNEAARRFDSAPLLEALATARIPAGPVRPLDEALGPASHLHLKDRQGRVRGMTQRIWRGGPPSISPDAPPALGQHTFSVLAELAALDGDQLNTLHHAGIVFQEPPHHRPDHFAQ